MQNSFLFASDTSADANVPATSSSPHHQSSQDQSPSLNPQPSSGLAIKTSLDENNDPPSFGMGGPSFMSNNKQNEHQYYYPSDSIGLPNLMDSSMDRPMSAPLHAHGYLDPFPFSPTGLMAPSTVINSTTIGSDSQSPMSPSTPSYYQTHQANQSHDDNFIPQPLTRAQKAALASVQQSQYTPGSLPLDMQDNLSAGGNSGGANGNGQASQMEADQILAMHGIDTSKLSTDQMRQLATQMRSISSSTASEIRRQLHIQSEQKRRALIKGGFDELRAEVPGCMDNKRMSKTAILMKTIEYIRRLKSEREIMYAELGRMRALSGHFGAAVNGSGEDGI